MKLTSKSNSKENKQEKKRPKSITYSFIYIKNFNASNISTVASSHAPSEQFLRRPDFADKFKVQITRGSNAEITFSGVSYCNKWNKHIIEIISRGRGHTNP